MYGRFDNMLYQHNNPKSYMDFLHVDFCLDKNQITTELVTSIETLLKTYGDLKISNKNTEKGFCEFRPTNDALKIEKIIIYKSGFYRVF